MLFIFRISYDVTRLHAPSSYYTVRRTPHISPARCVFIFRMLSNNNSICYFFLHDFVTENGSKAHRGFFYFYCFHAARILTRSAEGAWSMFEWEYEIFLSSRREWITYSDFICVFRRIYHEYRNLSDIFRKQNEQIAISIRDVCLRAIGCLFEHKLLDCLLSDTFLMVSLCCLLHNLIFFVPTMVTGDVLRAKITVWGKNLIMQASW